MATKNVLDGNDNADLPSFSFSIPTYNAAEYLNACLKSIFSQDYPREKVEVLVADGGSTDGTLSIARRYPVKVLGNPKRLADYGAKIIAGNSVGDLLVVFAADNELPSKDWLRKVGQIFNSHPQVCAFWCNMISSEQDAKVNKYYELIKSDPLMFFVNTNLRWYLRETEQLSCNGEKYHLFTVARDRPLVWGANGLVLRSDLYKSIILRDEYIGDNDVFQEMVERGRNLVAYSTTLTVYHHHLKSLRHWMNKWERNYRQHTLGHIETRNMNWVNTKNLKPKLLLWILYSLFPIFSFSHAVFLSIRQRNRYWLYHPLASFLQSFFLLKETLASRRGRAMIRRLLTAGGVSHKQDQETLSKSNFPARKQ